MILEQLIPFGLGLFVGHFIWARPTEPTSKLGKFREALKRSESQSNFDECLRHGVLRKPRSNGKSKNP